MFLEGIDFDSQPNDPVQLARPTPIDARGPYKSYFSKLPRLKSIITHQQQIIAQGLSPKNTSARPEISGSFLEKPLHTEENVTVRGPKVISKNLPEVFISSTPSALKVRKFSGLRKRNRAADVETNSFGSFLGQVLQTEPDGDAKCYGSPLAHAQSGQSCRNREGAPRLVYDEQGHLRYVKSNKEIAGRSSICVILPESMNEGIDGQRRESRAGNLEVQRLKSAKENLRRPDHFASFSDNISPTSAGGLSNFHPLSGNRMQIDTRKLSPKLQLNYPRSATNKPQSSYSNVSLDFKRKNSAQNQKFNALTDMSESTDYNFKENFKVFTKESIIKKNKEAAPTNGNSLASFSIQANPNPNPNPTTNNTRGGFFGNIPSNFKMISKNEDITKQIKKLFVFKKITSKSPDTPMEDLRVKVLEKGVKPSVLSSFRLNELITLKKVKMTQNRGAVKRMLHAPTFKIYDLQEEPISELGSKEAMHIKERLNEWRSNFFNSPYLLRIYSCFWNSPEGCVSILLEPSKSGLLNEIISRFGNVPERFVWALAKDLSLGVTEIHQRIRKPHGNISINEVCIDSQDTFKLGPGISQAFYNAFQHHHNKYSNSQEESNSQKNWVNSDQKLPSTTTAIKESLAQDIFDFGYLLLQCAIGDFSIYDPSGLLTLENLKTLLDSRALKKHSPNACCILHSEELVRKLLESSSGALGSKSSSKKKIITNSFLVRSPRASDLKTAQSTFSSNIHIPLLDALKTGNRFSDSFADLLCNCLQLDEQHRMRAGDLINHEFLSEKHKCNGPNISVREFLRAEAKENEHAKNLAESFTESHLEKFTEALSVVFLNKNVQDKFEKMLKKDPSQRLDDAKIQDLANELEVSPKKLWNHIKACISDLRSHA